MRLRNNEIAACLVIALGVGSVLTGALLQEISTGKTAQQPESVAAAYVEPTPAPETTPEPMPTVETVRFSATGDDLIHDGIFLQARERGGDHYDFDAAYAAMQALVNAIDKADSTDSAKIMSVLRTENVETTVGKIKFDSKGDAEGVGFSVYRVKNGAFAEVK